MVEIYDFFCKLNNLQLSQLLVFKSSVAFRPYLTIGLASIIVNFSFFLVLKICILIKLNYPLVN